ncbi:MAG: hypothetical protein IT389_15965 [Nitrospira sp.]|nr:hypothetical protein [Nitrospira sp.]
MKQTKETDQTWRNGNPSLSLDSHAIQTQNDSGLLQGERAALTQVIVNHDSAIHPIIGIGGALIGESPIGVANFDVSADLSTPGGDGAVANFRNSRLSRSKPFRLSDVSATGWNIGPPSSMVHPD